LICAPKNGYRKACIELIQGFQKVPLELKRRTRQRNLWHSDSGAKLLSPFLSPFHLGKRLTSRVANRFFHPFQQSGHCARAVNGHYDGRTHARTHARAGTHVDKKTYSVQPQLDRKIKGKSWFWGEQTDIFLTLSQKTCYSQNLIILGRAYTFQRPPRPVQLVRQVSNVFPFLALQHSGATSTFLASKKLDRNLKETVPETLRTLLHTCILGFLVVLQSIWI
jgi:hypothetical protein